jgi:pyruvate/2-oxoglutarate dehydrogenase complex dihydrolipoamide dehydrogenase (E3) component
MHACDLAVIGAGAAGLAAAQVGRAQGRRVLLIEKARLGGECTWTGCVPSKALIQAASIRHQIAGAGRFGITPGRVNVDFSAVMARVHDVVGQIARYEDREHLEQSGIQVHSGEARVVGPTTVLAGGEVVSAERIVIATGSRPLIPPLTGLAKVRYRTNETIFELTALPKQLIVIGGGSVGLELAQAFARLGSAVTVVDVAGTVLADADPDVARLIQAALEAEGITFRLGVHVAKIVTVRNRLRITLTVAGETDVITGDELLLASGRRPNVEDLGLETVGVRIDSRGIRIDDHCRTSVAEIYAAGDVTGMHATTHVAAYQGRIAAQNALGARIRADYRVVPRVTFTDPEVAQVGLTEPEARALRRDVLVAVLPFTAVDRAVISGRVEGMIKIITAPTTLGRVISGGTALTGRRVDPGGQILGAHIIGANAGELIHEFAQSMASRAFAGRLAQALHAYPTVSVGVQQAVAQLFPAGRAVAGELRTELAEPR